MSETLELTGSRCVDLNHIHDNHILGANMICGPILYYVLELKNSLVQCIIVCILYTF